MGSKKALAGVLLAVVVVVTAIALLRVRREAPSAEPTGATDAAGIERELARAPEEELAPVVAVESSVKERVAITGSVPVEAPLDALPDDLAEIRGRFVFENGAPAAGVALAMMGWIGNQKRQEKYGAHEDWVAPTGESDADGRFALRFEPPRAFQFTLDAQAPGYASANWRWSEIPPGKVLDVGEVALLRGGAIEGRVVNGEGKPVTGPGWTVSAYGGERVFEGRDLTRGYAKVDAATGAFRIEDMPPGEVELEGHHVLAKWVAGPVVLVVGGEIVKADIVYEGPLFGSRIVVSTSTQPFRAKSRPPADSIRLLGAASGPITARGVEGSSQSYVFDDLAPGTYMVEIDDPDYMLWSQDGVTPGSEVRARLVGSAALRLAVVDEADEPVELYSLRVRFRNVSFMPNEFEVHDGNEPLPGGLFEGMFPGDYDLTVRSVAGSAVVQVDALAPAETRDVPVRLGSSTVVRGRVTRGGQPVALVDVQLIRPAEVDDSNESWVVPAGSAVGGSSERFRFEVDSTATGEAGDFKFDLAGEGRFLLRAQEGGGVQALSEPFTVAAGQDREIDLSLPGTGTLLGRLLVPAGASPAGLRVWARAAGMDFRAMSDSFRKEGVTLGSEGTFELGPLAAGEAAVFLFLPADLQSGFSTGNGSPKGARELGLVTIPDSGSIEREFEVLEFPGSLRVSVTLDGLPAAGAQVRLVAEGGDRVQARTHPDGTTASIPLFPAPWNLYVVDEKAGWARRHPEFVYVVAGGEHAVEVDVTLIEGSVVLVDATTREPLANQTLALWPWSEDGHGGLGLYNTYKETNAEGRLTLRAPAGKYRLHLGQLGHGNEGDAREVILEWTDQGPAQAEVDL